MAMPAPMLPIAAPNPTPIAVPIAIPVGTAAKHASRRDDGVFRHLRDQPGRYEFFTGLRHEMTDAL